LPAGAGILLSHFITHRMPELYSQPDRFIPQRWEQIDPSPYEYMPFSVGPRMCVGATFAMMEMKIILAMMLMRFCFSLAATKLNYRTLPVLSLKNLPMQINKQDRHFDPVNVKGSICELLTLTGR
jgi:cytochrome P450